MRDARGERRRPFARLGYDTRTMSASFGVVYPLWNHEREPGNLLDRFVGEAGIDHVTIPVVTGPQQQFRPHFFSGAPLFHTEGGWHYPPGAAFGGQRPHVAAWCGRRDALLHVCEEARRYRLRIYLRLSLPVWPDARRPLPPVLCESPWGQHTAGLHVCANSPVLRELIEHALADFDRYAPDGIELEVSGWAGLLPALNLAACASLRCGCFCAACRQIAQAANVDVDTAMQRAREHIAAACATGVAGRVSAGTSVAPELAAVDAARRASRAAWLRHLAGQIKGRRFLMWDAGGAGAAAPAGGERGSPTEWEPLLDLSGGPGLEPRATEPHAAAIVCRAWQPASDPAAALVRSVHEHVAGRVTFFDFAGAEEGSFDVLTALKQAIRYARRV